jgi:hypothetical protein
MPRPKIPRARATLTLAALLIAGCAAQPRPPPLTAPALLACESLWETERAAARTAGVTHAALRKVPGFPHYRSTRLLASFAEEDLGPEALQEWTDRLRGAALEAAAVERTRRDAPPLPARLEDCAQRLQQADLADPRRLAGLRAAVTVPDDYSLTARTLGVYPLAKPFLGLGVAAYRRAVARWTSAPLDPATPLRHYRPPAPPPAAPQMAVSARSALGFLQLDAAAWEALAYAHAPVWEIETASADDHPARPYRDDQGRLQVSPAPVTYWYAGATRYHGQLLTTLVYTLWFPARPPSGPLDPYAGTLDGLVWRVVLDAEGQPLVYDSIHPCGCYRYTYARDDLRLRPPVAGQEPALLPQGLGLPAPPIRLRLRTGDHQLLRVLADQPRADAVPYALRPYAELEAGRLFGRDGLVEGSERGERWWLWPSGVPSPGAMRQRGRQPTAFVGRAHFDDPDFLDVLFFPPDAP